MTLSQNGELCTRTYQRYLVTNEYLARSEFLWERERLYSAVIFPSKDQTIPKVGHSGPPDDHMKRLATRGQHEESAIAVLPVSLSEDQSPR
jgi:hypothetical protein